MLSGLGRNIQTCYERFSLSVRDATLSLSDAVLDRLCSCILLTCFSRALTTIEFIMLGCQFLSISD